MHMAIKCCQAELCSYTLVNIYTKGEGGLTESANQRKKIKKEGKASHAGTLLVKKEGKASHAGNAVWTAKACTLGMN